MKYVLQNEQFIAASTPEWNFALHTSGKTKNKTKTKKNR